MKFSLLVIAAVVLFSSSICTTDAEQTFGAQGRVQKTTSNDEPVFKITINPEGRVSVALLGTIPKDSHCKTAVTLTAKIINQGFLTARLEAELVDVPPGVTLDFQPEALKGIPEEFRKLRITLTNPGVADLTIAFRAHNGIPDLGGRDRVHFLVNCQ